MSVWGDKLDAATTGKEFGAVLGGLFAALETAMEDEEDADE